MGDRNSETLQALLDDALESFETHSHPSGASHPASDDVPSSSSPSLSKPKFDPLHAGKRKPTSTTTSEQTTQTQTIFSDDNGNEDDDVSALTESLGRLLEELAGAGNNGAGDKGSGDTLAATLAALAAQHGAGNNGGDQLPPEDIFAQLFAAAAGGSNSGAPSTNKPNSSSSSSRDTSKEGGSSSSDPQLPIFLDSLMHQLVSKEVLYQPMKDIAGKYPQWLADNEGKLSDGDKERFTKQLQCITELIDIYENDPTNYPVLMDVMQTMQECGNPPDDIVEELAPGMQFGGEGGGGRGGTLADLSFADCCIQ